MAAAPALDVRDPITPVADEASDEAPLTADEALELAPDEAPEAPEAEKWQKSQLEG